MVYVVALARANVDAEALRQKMIVEYVAEIIRPRIVAVVVSKTIRTVLPQGFPAPSGGSIRGVVVVRRQVAA